MRVPLSWICDFAPVEGDARDIANSLDELGLVVEELVHVGEGLQDVVVARVEEIAAIEGADRIRRVVVDAGNGPVEVVCGAWNFAEGDLVPLAPVGAVLPGGFEIARRKMKGVVSNGMLCSPRELDLAEDHQGIMVLGSVPGRDSGGSGFGSGSPDGLPTPGTPLLEALGIERDVVFDIAVTANRPDAWSVAGVARDLAAARKVPFRLPEPPAPATGTTPVASSATVEVADPDLCPRFTARVLGGVRVGPSPAWVARRIVLAGMRPINNVVDASNYVMLELGQPTHPYDLDRLAGGGLRVRAAVPGEVVVTLDGVARAMGTRAVGGGDDRRDCLICDGTDAPVGIGGIMGGASSEIAPETTRVLLEAAYFTPMAIARTSKRLALRTEASARFERGCDPEGIDRAAERLVEVLGVTGGETMRMDSGTIDVRGDVPGPGRVVVRTERVNAVLGTELATAEVAELLEPIGFACRIEDGALAVTVPTFRPDTEREIDVIEEVARLHGYARIARRRPHAPQVGGLSGYQRGRRFVREVVAGLGAHEAWTPSLLAPGDHERAGMTGDSVTLANPLTDEESVLRRSLLPGLLKAMAFNAARRQGELRLFEIGHVFPPPPPERVAAAVRREAPSVIDERELLAAMLAWPGDDATSAARAWHVLADALDVRDVQLSAVDDAAVTSAGGAGLHPTRRALLVTAAGVELGVVGEVDPAVAAAFGLDADRQRFGYLELDLERLLASAPHRARLAPPMSRFPSSDLDLAFVVSDDVPAAAVAAVLREAAGDLVEWVRLFDVFRGDVLPPATRSLAFRLRFQAEDHTLGEEELRSVRQRCIEAVTERLGGVLRG